MKKKLYALSLSIAIILIPYFVFANETMNKLKEVGASKNGVYKDNTTLTNIVGNVINGFLNLLAIIFLIIIIMDGYKYMTARGDEDKVKIAIAGIRRGIIGLIIILSAWGITYFVVNTLTNKHI